MQHDVVPLIYSVAFEQLRLCSSLFPYSSVGHGQSRSLRRVIFAVHQRASDVSPPCHTERIPSTGESHSLRPLIDWTNNRVLVCIRKLDIVLARRANARRSLSLEMIHPLSNHEYDAARRNVTIDDCHFSPSPDNLVPTCALSSEIMYKASLIY